MVIDPDNDLLIFRIRRERSVRGGSGIGRSKSGWSTHNFSFSSAKMEIERIDRPIAEGIGRIVRSAEAVRSKRHAKNPVSESQPSILAEKEREIDDMDKRVKDMLDAMKMINERQRELSGTES